MAGFFGIGIEKVSKVRNIGNLIRTANAFDASFAFTIGTRLTRSEIFADTSKSIRQVPYFEFASADDMVLPLHCKLVGVELTEDAVDLPSFMHPPQAAYVLGQERGSVSDCLLERCDYVIRIPTSFCVNVATAGAIIMYDRVRTRGRFPPRPIATGAPLSALDAHRHGGPKFRRSETPDA